MFPTIFQGTLFSMSDKITHFPYLFFRESLFSMTYIWLPHLYRMKTPPNPNNIVLYDISMTIVISFLYSMNFLDLQISCNISVHFSRMYSKDLLCLV